MDMKVLHNVKRRKCREYLKKYSLHTCLMKKNKKLIIIIGILILLIIVIVLIVLLNKKVYFEDLIMKDKYNHSKLVEDYKFADSLKEIKGDVYLYKKDVYLDSEPGKMYYVRGIDNANIYVFKKNASLFDSGIPILVQIKEYINYIDQIIIDKLNIEISSIDEEYDKTKPIEESIYNDNGLYYKRIYTDNNIYYINYYYDGSDIVIEIARFL